MELAILTRCHPGRRLATAGLVVLVALSLGLSGCARRGRGSVDTLAWLSGCWAGKSGEGLVDEQWGKPAGGSLLGTSRIVKGERTVQAEFLTIREVADGLVLTVHPQGQAPVSYHLARSGKANAVFENAAHDFPQRITYYRQGGTLHVRAEGQEGDDRRQLKFKLRKAACD